MTFLILSGCSQGDTSHEEESPAYGEDVEVYIPPGDEPNEFYSVEEPEEGHILSNEQEILHQARQLDDLLQENEESKQDALNALDDEY
ncbi:MAG: hypothetical protein OEZ23_07590 [Gammaproteobacteria bacterium]|nr:hypothetical protein [Gammaproteobacteria bacterium]